MRRDFHATAMERAVGRKLAAWRVELGLSQVEAGARAGFSSAKLSLMENAAQPTFPLDVMALGYALRVPTPDWQVVFLQAQHAEQLRTATRQRAGFDPVEDLPHLVAEAMAMRMFTTDLVPTIFQIAPYTEAVGVHDASRCSRLELVRSSWEARCAVGDPITVEAVFPEAVLKQVVGGRQVMKAQLVRLMEVSELSSVKLRVVPCTEGAYPAMGFPFTWLSFPRHSHGEVVYLETLLRGEYVEGDGQIEEVAHKFAALWDMALGEDESMELIAEAAAFL